MPFTENAPEHPWVMRLEDIKTAEDYEKYEEQAHMRENNPCDYKLTEQDWLDLIGESKDGR
jgi:hypothetical protein